MVERIRNSGGRDVSSQTSRPPLPVPEPVQRLNRFLEAAAVDLGRVGREIRSHPDLESLVERMAVSLALSPADSIETPEDAVVVLGADRLRVVFYMWWLMKQKSGATAAPQSPPWSPEALYLASFLRYLRLDSPSAAILHHGMFAFAVDPRRADFADLRDMLMRDLLALIPVIDPSVLPPTALASGDPP
ncbi:MAG TPA: HDOD domain-containing protein [Verrucomicrobiae bacterium]|nr:HDOD domain-containing protein [Verrucomicrobiae bacterium]